jgi:hypothetical protein
MIRSELISELENATYVSLLLDGSTDKGVEELILYVRLIKAKRVKEVFLSVTPLQNATAEGYLKAAEKELEKHGLLDWLSSNNLIGIGTDGAISLLGTEHGLI